MASSREIRRRIKSVKSTQQITKAMKMVAAARLRRAQEKANASKPYALKIKEVLSNVAAHAQNITHPLLEVREQVKKVAYFVISADKGLAGSYNANLIKEAVTHIGNTPSDGIAVVGIGRKINEYLRRREYPMDNQYSGFSERPNYQDAVMIAKEMTRKFTSGEYDEIYIVYTKFFSAMRQEPTAQKLLPLEAPKMTEGQEVKESFTHDLRDYIFEPSAEETLQVLVPKYLEITVYTAMMQSAASELGARMTAMGAATDNAKEVISELTLHYNKVRQAGITREISEIVGGAEALK